MQSVATASAKPPVLDVKSMTTGEALTFVFERAMTLLPADVGQELRSMIAPGSIATMATAVGIWAVAHFFGVGEIADIMLLVVGYAALGGVAVEAAEHVASMIEKVASASSEADLNEAAEHLAKAISLIGVQMVLAILLRKKPEDTFKTSYKGKSMPPYSEAFSKPLPRNGGIAYTPSTKFTNSRFVGEGGTTPVGDITLGRYGKGENSAEALKTALFHEKVHQFFKPKLYIFREVRIYLAESGYRQSYVLRYLEEAIAETVAQLRVHGLDSAKLWKGVRFPLDTLKPNGRPLYEVTLSDMKSEVKGVLLGPVTVGQMVYQAYLALSDD